MNRSTFPVAAVALAFALSACSGSNTGVSTGPDSSVVPQTAQRSRPHDTLGGIGNLLAIVLTDAPPVIGNLTPTAIDLGVDSVGVISNGTVTTIASYPTPYVVNVLAAQSDPSSIGIGQYFSGSYQQLVFTFDVASSKVVAGGASYPITFLPNAASQSSSWAGMNTVTTGNATTVSVVVNGNFTVGGNPAAAVQADFNAYESLAMNAQGGIVSRPTLFAVPSSLAGKIAGTVQNAAGSPVSGATVVVLNQNGTVANTGNTGSDGSFAIHTIAAGAYSLRIFNTYTTATGQQVNASGNTSTAASFAGPALTVTAGGTTQTGPISD